MSRLAALCLLLLQTGAHGFGIFGGESLNHQEITERAILNTTLRVCHSLALAEGRDFKFPPQPFTAESVTDACDAAKSSKSFRQTIQLIQDSNVGVDRKKFYSSRHHFDDEQFAAGRELITSGLSALKASIKRENFEAARTRLGQILHSLQDFYSHSSWVEIGNRFPNSNLIRSDTRIGNVAAPDRATCRNCEGNDCRNNILEDILREKILTTGYFSLLPLASKPAGKCSHGGGFDRTKSIEPTGGINKDELDSEHGHLHAVAANVAVAATNQLLEDVRGAAGDRKFLQLMGINKGKALCFVIDTTGSMGDDINAVRIVTSAIIDSKVGTEDEPSVYILVPFNDPGFGPLTRTTNPGVFKAAINSLTATGGGDFKEMSLSGLRLALTGAPPGSEIFLFTDAPAKDIHLKSAVVALIERTKSVVNFMITGSLGLRRRRRSESDNDQQQQQQPRMSSSTGQVYSDLAQKSGGQAVQTQRSQLLEVITILTESSSSSQVILLQAARAAGKDANFTFSVDESMKNLRVYITGRSVAFTLISPSGVSQHSTNLTGSLINESMLVGNFQTLQLAQQVGLWEMKMASTTAYTLKVIGESPIDFLFDFLEVSDGPLGGFDILENRPRAGVNGSLRVTLTGSVNATVTEVTLVESATSRRFNSSLEPLGDGNFLVSFDSIPSTEFVVLVNGQDTSASTRSSPTSFQRQSATSITASGLTVTADDSDSVLQPGEPLIVPFSVVASGIAGNVNVQATNDQGFAITFPSSLSLSSGGSTNGTVTLTAPVNTGSGTDVTLTIEVNTPSGDTNYAVLRLTVLTPVTDFAQPVCQMLSLQSNCSGNCSASIWELSLEVTDGANGTGIDRISFRGGDGTMNTNMTAGNNTLVSYNASCCSPDVEILVVDKVGNVASCVYTVRTPTLPATNSTEPPMTTTVSMSTTTVSMSTTTVSMSTRVAQSSLLVLLCLGATILGLG